MLVPDHKHVYISKQSGTYDLYSMDLDGKNAKLLLRGTGLETSNLSLVPSSDGNRAALVSTRDNVRDSDGFLLTTLTLVDTHTGAVVTVDHGAQIQLLAWNGSRLAYRVAMAGASAANAQRYRLLAYNYDTAAKLQLTTANQFTVSQAARGAIYYAASSSDLKATMGLFRIKPDGSGKQKVFDKELWTALRTGYDTFALQTPDKWYTYTISTGSATESTPPATLANLTYLSNSTDTHSLVLGQQTGHIVLSRYDTATAKQTVLTKQDGIALPLYWAGDNAVVYRVATSAETADYVVSPNGGQAHKLADVWPTYGIGSE
jgi:hypothetical protein